MKVLVSTKETQGQRKNDFSWTNDRELVTFGFECSREKVDGNCGCKRSMVGLMSRMATTTMKVIEVDIHPDEYFLSIRESLKEGWGTVMNEKEINQMAREDAQKLICLASAFTTGKIVERRGRNYRTRV